MTNLRTRKALAAKVLKVGKNRIHLSNENLAEIKEAITKQDIKDLYKEGFISIKPIKGRKKVKKRKTRRGPGKIKRKVKKRKQVYVKITRKLRNYLKQLKTQKKISNELFLGLRKKIRMRVFRSKAHLKEYLINVEKIDLIKKIELTKSEKKKEKSEKKSVKKTKTNKKQNLETKKLKNEKINNLSKQKL